MPSNWTYQERSKIAQNTPLTNSHLGETRKSSPFLTPVQAPLPTSIRVWQTRLQCKFSTNPVPYNFLKKMRPHIGVLGACLSCLLSTGGHVHVGLAGKKRRLSLDDAG